MTITDSAPRLSNATDRRAHQLLAQPLGHDGVVIAGKRVIADLNDHEVYLLVAIEGIVSVEVNAGTSGTTARDGGKSGGVGMRDRTRAAGR